MKRAVTTGLLAGLLGLLGAVSGLSAQQTEPLKLSLVEAPRVGREMPTVVLPYLTREGAGPVSQPFNLSKELGRAVLLVFRGANDPVPEPERWMTLSTSADSALLSGVVLAGVSEQSRDSLLGMASRLQLSYKLLHDSAGRLARKLDLDPGATTLLIVGRDGRLVYREERLPSGPILSRPGVVAALKTAKERP